MKRRTNAKSSLDNLIRLIPGYDPYNFKISTAVARHKEDPPYWFDEEESEKVISFFAECLTHVKGELAHKPFELGNWEKAILANLFGWKRKDGTRRYREAFIYVPRKNGKTTLVAGIVLYTLFCDNEPGAEIYSAAAERDQARLVFDQAKGMVLQEPELAKRCKIYQTSIVIESTSSSYKAISAEANTKHGYNTHLAIIDELHAQPNRELVDVLATSTGARRQPLIVHITTADFERESICNEKLDYARKVRDGLIEDPSFLPVIYEATPEDDWTDPAIWEKANPNLGVSVSREYLERECQRAKDQPAYENTFKRLHLNIKTEQETRWLSMEKWNACGHMYGEDALAGLPCWAGLDLASRTDLTAFVLVFHDDTKYKVVPYFWIPKDKAHEREKRDRVPYLTWARQGHIYLTEGNTTDYRFIRQKINELSKVFKIQDIGFDPWNAQHLCTELMEEDGFQMVEFRQGTVSMNEPCKEFERLMLCGDLWHNNNPVLNWMASNVSVKSDPSGNIRPVKPEEKGAARIDGIVAAVMGLGRALFSDASDSVYESRGLLTL